MGKRTIFDIIRAEATTIPGLLAHQAAIGGGGWLDVPLYGRR